MKRKALVSAVMAIFMSTGGPAFAQGNSDRNDRDRNEQSQRNDQQERRDNDGRNQAQERRDRDNVRRDQAQERRDRDNLRRDQAQERRDNDARRNEAARENRNHANSGYIDRRDERGAGPNHEFYRGQRLPSEYRHRQYVVNDWRGHNLSAPPSGYQWVQTGSDYVLVAIASGIIMQLLLNN